MKPVEVSKKVWERLLAIRHDDACACCGDWSALEQAALDLYSPLARRDTPALTVGQIGQSIDGRIAPSNGEVGKVSGPDGLEHLHRMRALVDGVVIGIKTALHDSPQLTVRLCEGMNPARIVIDSSGRLPDDSPVLREDGVRRIVIQAVESKRAEGVEVMTLPSPGGQFDPAQVLDALRQAGLANLMIEGGSFTIAKFMEAGLLDRLHIAVSPTLIGAGPIGITVESSYKTLKDSRSANAASFVLGLETVYDLRFGGAFSEAKTPRHPQ